MKYLLFVLFTLVLSTTSLVAQFNTNLISNLAFPELRGNDIWAYVAADGTEYALMGLQNGVSVVSLADPANPVEVAFANGIHSIWRDTKTWGDYAYTTNEQTGGLLVMDLSMLPDAMPYYYWSPEIPELGTIKKCHNLYIDEFGYAYLSGCNVNSGGVLFVDVFSDPGNPIYIGHGDARYSHDAYVRDNKLYSSDLIAGFFSITDVTDKANPVLLTTQHTPFKFTHNTWLSDDGNVLFTTDERANASTASYDISDLSDIRLLDEFRPEKTLNEGVIPHNVHVLNDYLVISHYTDGVMIVDASRPDNLIEVGYYDTFNGAHGRYNGCWGAYPYLPSGLILLSDIQSGLVVIEPDYVRACYLEGLVTDAATGEAIINVEVKIESEIAAAEETDLIGIYKTGQVEAGRFSVSFSKFGYISQTLQVDLINGELTELNVALEPTARFAISGQTILATNNSPAANALIRLESEEINYSIQSDENGMFNLDNIVVNEYTLYIGGWGYHLNPLITLDETAAGEDLIFQLEKGYRDEFELDLGWTIESEENKEIWERSIPANPDEFFINIDTDVEFDLGNKCYLARNISTADARVEYKEGLGTIRSPSIDLSNYQNPILSYYRWFLNTDSPDIVNNQLEVRLSNGIEEIVLETIAILDTTWQKSEFYLNELDIELTSDMHVLFETGDMGDSLIIEAGIDYFEILDEVLNEVDEVTIAATKLTIAPNPFTEAVQIEIELPKQLKTADLKLYNVLGELVNTTQVHHLQKLYWGDELSRGVYFLTIETEGQAIFSKKMVKQ